MLANLARSCVVVLVFIFGFLVQVRPGIAASDYTFNWSGTPSAPTAWSPSTGFDLVIHDRDLKQNWNQPYAFQAQHGSDCSPFKGFGQGGTHIVTEYRDLAFICNNHLMTGINGEGYGEITFTPAVMLDWSQGTATASWHVSTLRTSCRDWLSFNVMPFMDNLALTDGFGVDLAGEPRNGLLFTTSASCPGTYHGYDIRNFNESEIGGRGGAVEDVLSTSASVRTHFELDVSRTHVRFGLPDSNMWMVDSDLKSPLPYTQAVVQFGQHSYSPEKECSPTPTFCAANTWHWSDLSYSRIAPFTILRGDTFQVTHAPANVVHLPQPAPANSFLRMEAIALPGSMKVSPDSGKTWIPITTAQPSTENQSGAFTQDHMNNVFLPIPAGTQSLTFAASDPYWIPWVARNVSVWSSSAAATVPGTPPPPPNTPTPSAAQNAVPITDVPCTVKLNGRIVTGTCSGTFKPDR